MTLYQALCIIVTAYSAVTIIFAITSMVYEVKHKFRPQFARYAMFQSLNRLQGKHFILWPFIIFSLAALISWTLLAFPWVDTISGMHWLTQTSSTPLDGSLMKTYLGDFRNKETSLYFIIVFFNIISVKGYYVCAEMAKILLSDRLAVNVIGHWGSDKDFIK